METEFLATPSSAVLGTTTNDNAPAGRLGEFVTATVAVGAAVPLTTGVAANVTSISLTAGDWKITAQCNRNLGATTSVTLLQAGVSLTTATIAGQAGGAGLGTDPTAIATSPATIYGGTVTKAIGPVRLSINATTMVFLVAQDTFTVSTNAVYGTLSARRMR